MFVALKGIPLPTATVLAASWWDNLMAKSMFELDLVI